MLTSNDDMMYIFFGKMTKLLDSNEIHMEVSLTLSFLTITFQIL